MKLFVDDMRPFPDEIGWACSRNYREAVSVLERHDVEYASLDYHLGAGESGLDLLEWMYDNRIRIPHINIHSSHPVGRMRMKSFIERFMPYTTVTMEPYEY
ncbi:MAG: hypothetical protein E7660_07015 [Ruminococcaceae bacterium]|nr:hypothetical protein [Oscillospiraceae bacterium]